VTERHSQGAQARRSRGGVIPRFFSNARFVAPGVVLKPETLKKESGYVD